MIKRFQMLNAVDTACDLRVSITDLGDKFWTHDLSKCPPTKDV